MKALTKKKAAARLFALLNIKDSTWKGSFCCGKNFCWHLQLYGMIILIKQDCYYFWCSQNFHNFPIVYSPPVKTC